MITPLFVIIIKSSSPVTVLKHTRGPFFSVIRRVLTPLPPRPFKAYSLAAVRLPYPFSLTTNTSRSGVKISIPIT